MPKWKEGDRVKVVTRDVTLDDRKSGRYFDHMHDLVGTIQNVYAEDEVAVKVERDTMSKVATEVQKEALRRMREKFLGSISDEQKGRLTPEELNFGANYVLLVRSADLVKA